MPNIIISPNMGMPVPVPGVDPGPDWANNIVACLSIIDQHNHSLSKGVVVTPGGININANLPFNGFYAASLGAAAFSAQSATLASSVTTTLYVANSDLYYNDGSGNVVRLTQGGSVPGSPGTITGLPSGTASASYAAGTFTFLSSTTTYAALQYGNSVQKASGTGNTVTTTAPNALAAGYTLTWPTALSVTTGTMQASSTGQLTLTAAPGFDEVTISGVNFKVAAFSGGLAAGSNTIPIFSFTAILGIFGLTSTAGVFTSKQLMGNQANSTNRCYVTVDTGGGFIQIFNSDPSNTNVYNLVIFYV